MAADSAKTESYEDLLTLFSDWRAFEHPPLLDGAPDYTAAGFDRPATPQQDALLSPIGDV